MQGTSEDFLEQNGIYKKERKTTKQQIEPSLTSLTDTQTAFLPSTFLNDCVSV